MIDSTQEVLRQLRKESKSMTEDQLKGCLIQAAGQGERLQDEVIKRIQKAERARCEQIIDDEICRARGLLELHDESGWVVFDREQTEAGIAALEHVLEAIRGSGE